MALRPRAAKPNRGATFLTKGWDQMPDGGTVFLEMLLLNSLAILVAGVGFVAAVEGWRRWSDARRITKRFQQ